MCKQVAHSHNTGKEQCPVVVLGLDSEVSFATNSRKHEGSSWSTGAQRVTQ